jgi:hypothetical protein
VDHPDGAYRCPKCGATSALLLPEPIAAGESPAIASDNRVALKCLQCAHVQRVSRQSLEGVAGRFDSIRSRA